MANGDDDEPETFTCRLAIVCDGGPHQMSELSSKNPLTSERVGECNACNRERARIQHTLRANACRRLGIPIDGQWRSWRERLSRDERAVEIARQEVIDAGLAEQPDGGGNEGEQQVDPQPVAPVAEQENLALNMSDEDAEWLAETNPAPPENEVPAGQAATSGIIYLGENIRAWDGWVVSGKFSTQSRLGGYQTGDPFREYRFIATARVEDGLSDAEDRLQEELDAQTTRRGVPSDTGDSEWFEIDRDLAVEILRELNGITGFRDLRIENGD